MKYIQLSYGHRIERSDDDLIGLRSEINNAIKTYITITGCMCPSRPKVAIPLTWLETIKLHIKATSFGVRSPLGFSSLCGDITVVTPYGEAELCEGVVNKCTLLLG